MVARSQGVREERTVYMWLQKGTTRESGGDGTVLHLD